MPHDTNELATAARALWVGTAGALKVTTVGGSVVTFASASGWMPVRTSMPVRARIVWAAGTTAADIVGVW